MIANVVVYGVCSKDFDRNKILMKIFICSTEDVLERIMDHRLDFFICVSVLVCSLSLLFLSIWILTFGTNQVISIWFASFYWTFTSTSSMVTSHFCRQSLERGAWWLKKRLTSLYMRAHQHPVHCFLKGGILEYQAACNWLHFRTHHIGTSFWNRNCVTEKDLGTLFIWDNGEKQVVRRVF